MDNVFIIKQITEKRKECNLETLTAIIDLVKTSDRVDRLKLWKILHNRGYPQRLIQLI
jgi:hypothetical protein